MSEADDPGAPFFLIVADHDRMIFSVEGPMTDDHVWQAAARRARDRGASCAGRAARTVQPSPPSLREPKICAGCRREAS